MKQTNNAIKFLMAQYRAIFKNANIAMVAAMVASALAAGQAQAAAGDDGLNPLGKFETELKDSIIGKDDNLTHSADKYAVLSAPANKPISVENGGKLTLSYTGKNAKGNLYTGNDLVVNSGGTITLKGSEDTKADIAGLVGAAKETSGQDRATPTASLTINKDGKLDVTSSFAMMKDVNINGTVSIKGTTGKNTADAQSGEYLKYAAVYAESGNLTVGNDAAVTLGAASHLYGQNIAINGGTITFEGTTAAGKGSNLNAGALLRAGDSKDGGALTISNGKLNVTANKSGDIVATTLNMNGGEINVSGSLAIGGNYHANAPAASINVTKGKVKVATGGNLKLYGEATFADGTVANSGTIEAVSGSKINVANTTGLYSASGQLNLTGATLNFTGAALDLSDTAAKISGDASSVILAEKGTVTLATGFDSKTPNVTAKTILAKTGTVTLDSTQKTKTFLIQSGTVTALSELKGAESDAVIQVFDTAKQGTAKLVLGADEASVGKLTNVAKVNVGHNSDDATKHKLTVNGKWDFGGARLNAGAGGTVDINQGAEISNIERLQIGGTATNTIVNIKGTANIQRLLGSEGTGTVNVTGNLNILGDGKKETANESGNYVNDVQLTKATLNINAGGTVSLAEDAWDDVIKIESGSTAGVSNLTVVASGDKATDFGGWDKDKVKINAGGTLSINLSGYKVADKAAIDKLVADLKAADSKGLIDFGGLSIGKVEANKDGTIELDKMPTAKTETTQNLEVNLGNITSLDKSYSMGSANVSGSSLTVAGGSTLEFNNAKNGQFATNKNAAAGYDSSVNVTLAANSALILNGNGSLGNIQNSGNDTTVVLGGDNGTQTVGVVTQTVGVVEVENFKQVGGNVTTTGAITATGATTIKGVLNAAGKVNSKSLVLSEGSTLNITAAAGAGAVSAESLTVGAGSSISAAGQDITAGASGSGKAASILGDVTAKSLTLSGDQNHIIAGDAKVKLDTLNLSGTGVVQVGDDEAEANGSATVVVKNLSGTGTLFVDPKYREHAALVIAESLDAPATPSSNDAGTLQGSAIVGNNAALGIGFGSVAELKAVLGQFLDADGSFTENPAADKLELANALVLNKQIKIDSNKGILVKKGATATPAPTLNSVTLDAGTGLIVTDNVYSVQADGSKSGAAITFGTNGTVNGGGKVILSGNFDGKDDALQIFSNVQTVSGTLSVQSANGLLKGEINGNNKGTVDLNVDETVLKDAFTGVSAPVAELLKNTIRGEYKGAKGLGADFVYTVAGTSLTGAEVDAAAHAATYAGAQQAAVAAVTTMADAMFGRVGAVGVEAASISATGSQANGGVWLTPMYKSVDSDGFNAEGVSYGSDVDLAGVAFGTDTVNGNMRFGAVFNIGSGDADGKGQGNGLKDEFDYYGFGIYSAMGFGNFALVGDASMTVISHDVEGFGLKGKADTTAVTMGVTGQYTFATPMVDVTPHLGARFIRLNTDSYDLTSADGVLATTDFDVQNVFSVPVGVTLSKAFVAGGWSLAPSADLTIAFNTGDTDAKSNTQFNSSKSMSVATNTEVLDEVTYGLTLGLGAQYGAFGTSFGINYTGSSNTDSLGVNAQARYMF